MMAFLALVPRWVYEALGAAALVAAIWFSGVFHERAVIQTRVVKQEVQVEKRIVETDHSHDQELTELRAFRDSHTVEPVRLCVADTVHAPAAEGQPSTAADAVQPVSSGDSSVRQEPGPDISGLLEALAARADQVSADLRRRQELEP
jgi:hypothetical protein